MLEKTGKNKFSWLNILLYVWLILSLISPENSNFFPRFVSWTKFKLCMIVRLSDASAANNPIQITVEQNSRKKVLQKLIKEFGSFWQEWKEFWNFQLFAQTFHSIERVRDERNWNINKQTIYFSFFNLFDSSWKVNNGHK